MKNILYCILLLGVIITQQSPALGQSQDLGITPRSTTIPAGISVQLTYSNDPPSQEALDGLEKIRQAKARRVHVTPTTPIVEGLAIADPSGAESIAAQDQAPSNSFAPGDYQAYENNVISSPAAGFRSTVAEISLAANSNIIFATGNWWAAISFDHGNNWSNLNPFSDFPASDGGFCCDQEVIYDESRDMMVWVLQYSDDGVDNRYRIAYAVGHDNLARGLWTYIDILPTMVGLSTNRWFDYPHIALGSNRLFLTYNSFRTAAGTGGSTTGWMGLNLDNMAAGVGVQFSYWDQSTLFNFTPAQGSGNTYYWASHLNNTTLRVYRWTEGGSIFWDDVTHAAYQATVRGDANCPDSNGNDACVFFDDRVMGGWVANGQLGFVWMVAQGGSFSHPYTRFLRLNESDRSVVDQPIVFSNGGAWVFPSVGVNDRGHLGGTITWVADSSAPRPLTWIADDYNSSVLQPIENHFMASGTDGPQCERWGDYYRSRPHSPYGNTWVASGHTLNGGDGAACSFGSSQVTPRMVWFGRERDRPDEELTLTNFWASLLGPYIDDGTGNSSTGLNSYLPLSHPYCTSPWSYCGAGSVASMSSNIVDWGLIRIYGGHPLNPPMTLISEKVALIEDSGRIRGTDNSLTHTFSNEWAGKYWVAFYHRNHLGVLSNVVRDFAAGSASHSFRVNGSFGANSQKLANDGRYVMWGGNGSGDNFVTSSDYTNHWLPQNGGPPGYHSGDFDMNGEVTSFDFVNIWLPSNGTGSSAPAP